MRILLIAPEHPDLPSIDQVIADISRYHDVKRVVGIVREPDIRKAITEGEEAVTAGEEGFAILWFATHGGPEGMLLSNSILSPEGVGQYVSASGVKLCVMSTCHSEGVANRIIAGGDADMVCTISPDIKDEDASRFDSLFSAELSKLTPEDDFQEAFNKAAGPGTTKYRYIQAKQALRSLSLQATTVAERLGLKVETMGETVYQTKVNVEVLTKRVDQIVEQILSSQRQATQTQVASAQIADLDRQAASQKSSSPVALSPTFWAILALIALVIGLVLFYAGGGFR